MEIEEQRQRSAEHNLEGHGRRNHDRAVFSRVPEQRVAQEIGVVPEAHPISGAVRGCQIGERQPKAIDEGVYRKRREIEEAWAKKQPNGYFRPVRGTRATSPTRRSANECELMPAYFQRPSAQWTSGKMAALAQDRLPLLLHIGAGGLCILAAD